MSTKIQFSPPEWCSTPIYPYFIEILKDGQIIDKIAIEKPCVVLGRQPDAVDILLEHPSISRKHAVLCFKRDGMLMLMDLESAQGSYINKKKCEKDIYYQVFVGDLLRFAGSTRQYIVCGPDEHMPQEYDSHNLQKKREELSSISATQKAKRELEAQKFAKLQEVTWGFGEDAEEDDENERKDDLNEKESKLPAYLRNDPNFNRKYSEKYVSDIKDDEINDKDKDVIEKIRKKERKIENMQEETSRIYAKETSQADGLTEGQLAAVAKNDKSIESLKNEIEQLTALIRSKNQTRDGNNSNKKRSIDIVNENDDDVLDMTQQTADVNTNWRMKKKLSKISASSTLTSIHNKSNPVNGTILNHNNHKNPHKSLSYNDIKSEYDMIQTKIEEIKKNIFDSNDEIIRLKSASIMSNQSDSKNNNNNKIENINEMDEVQEIISIDRIKELSIKIKHFQSILIENETNFSALEKLLRIATPAIKSLVNETKDKIFSINVNNNNNNVNNSNVNKSNIINIIDNNNNNNNNNILDNGIANNELLINSHIKLEQNNVLEEEMDNYINHNNDENSKDSQVKFENSVEIDYNMAIGKNIEKVEVNDSNNNNENNFKKKSILPSKPTEHKLNYKIKVVDETNSLKQTDKIMKNDQKLFTGKYLEGGELNWMPPKAQSGDGKTSLNDKFGY
eukprot:gene9310-12545_t